MSTERESNSLRDKVILITGGANGIGRAVVSVAAAEGADVAIFDIDEPRLREAAAKVEAAGGRAHWEVVDLLDASQVEAGVNNVLEKFGRIDSLATVAGGSGTTATYLERNEETGDYIYKSEGMTQLWTEQVTEADWDGTMEFNLKTVFLAIRAVLPHMKERGGGTIVSFSSTGAMTGSPTGAFAYAAYAASKAGVSGMIRHLSRELGPFGIRANAVSPGAVNNPRMSIRRDAFTAAIDEAQEEGLEMPAPQPWFIPLGRASETREQAEAVIFLVSDRSSYINGVTLDVNGGGHMR
jgi:NAD(P)-dependent dehydrogenase (short-subunit alcohol dehydrogenase family)